MKDLIEALTIFLKYGNEDNPIKCEFDEMHVLMDPDDISQKDKDRLEELGFEEDGPGFVSYKYDSWC